MTRSAAVTTAEPTLHAALELSKNSWLLAIQFPERDAPSLYPLRGGDADGLMAKLDAARDRVAKVTGRMPAVTLCYEAGYDGFWLARLLEHHGIECLVMEPASLQVNRRARRVKTDRIDVEGLLHALIAWRRGERHVCSMVVIPSVEQEDLRRSHRERDRLVRERTAHINRIKGLLFGQGIRGINVKAHYKTLKPAALVTVDGRPLPDRLGREIARQIARLAQVQAQIVEIERERDQASTSCAATERKRRDLLRLKGIGPTFSAILAREVYYRRFANRRQVASYIGLAPSPYDSGDGRRSQGISKAGNKPGSLLLDPGRLAVAQASTELGPDTVVPAAHRGPGQAREVHHDRRPGAQTGDRPVALRGARPDPTKGQPCPPHETACHEDPVKPAQRLQRGAR